MKSFLQFISWPTFVGVLLALVLLQYQQIRQLSVRIDELALQSQAQISQPAPAQSTTSHASAVAKASPSVVSIHSTIREQIQLPPVEELPAALRDLLQNLPSERLWDSLGSGVAISDQGHILTALHVIEGAEDIEVHFNNSQGRNITARARLLGADADSDLALLQVDSAELPPAVPIGSSDDVNVGDTVLTIGYPRRDLMNQKSVSAGVVSALGIPRDGLPIVEYIQTDAAMNYGNSGGALINANGELIGINSFIYSQSGGSDGIGFAVPINKAMIVVEQLRQQGVFTPGYLGVITGELLNDETSNTFFGTPDIEGLLIEQVDANSPAEQAGIQAGDVMTHIDGQAIESVIGAIEQINRKPPGEQVVLTLYRAGESVDRTVTLGTGTAQYRTRLDSQ
ncbi:trypsin-like peptidase domain-containing protein [Pseudohongiella sp. SYSU M77423]|uniref:S1C family serine protease n=1 Tax=unclassified Pseudohongiella TaxID=2629611 RepID=UPI001F2C57DC|nr:MULTISPECIES: trypsin-like peptidase domain-containing protein [unclassified Pseudohongiella]MDH7944601.1 trypsin-like peptidase domain-containing protein [Pseudohongiella sp. SYSU M77423]